MTRHTGVTKLHLVQVTPWCNVVLHKHPFVFAQSSNSYCRLLVHCLSDLTWSYLRLQKLLCQREMSETEPSGTNGEDEGVDGRCDYRQIDAVSDQMWKHKRTSTQGPGTAVAIVMCCLAKHSRRLTSDAIYDFGTTTPRHLALQTSQ